MTTPDPFASDSHPSVSFANVPVGYTVTGTIVEAPVLLPTKNFETGQPKTWEDGNPVMAAVTVIEVDGEKRAIWAQKPSAMFAAIQAAQETGGRLAVGGTLALQYTGETPNLKNPRLNPIKQYRAQYTPPNPFATEAAPAQQQPQQSAPVLSGFTVPPTQTLPPLTQAAPSVPQVPAHNAEPWVAPTPANVGKLGESPAPGGDFTSRVARMRELAAANVPVGVIAQLVETDAATVAAVLASPAA